MRFRGFALTLALILLLTAPALAAEEVFTPTRSYGEEFSDVAPGAWYYDAVQALFELELINGKDSPDRFAPEDDMSLSEVLTLAARLRSLYETGDSESGRNAYGGDGGAWYLPYVAYLQESGVIGQEFEGSYEQPATRAQMAHVLANTLPETYFTPLNRELTASARDSGLFMQDVTASTAYEEDIVRLYGWGILGGTDETGSFLPDRPISRCEVAVMAARLAYAGLRLSLDWEVPPPYQWQGETLADLVTSDGAFYDAPTLNDADQIAADVRYMLSRGERSLTLHYAPGALNGSVINDLTQAFLYEVRQYIEQTYNYVTCTFVPQTGFLSMEFSSSLYEADQLEKYRQEMLAAALAVHDRMWEDGTITADMSDYDKARAYFTWICGNCRYDFSAVGNDASMSHSGWRVFEEGVAVCDGYTAAYNLLLKLEGIDCGTYTLLSKNHIWTVAGLDGKTYHIDATWGDQTGEIAYRFFGMTEAEALDRFS